MKKTKISEIVKAINGQLIFGKDQEWVSKVCIDSRTVEPDALFFTLIGEKQDGHKFIGQVIDGGCKCIVVSDTSQIDEKKAKEKGVSIILVADTTKALQLLAMDCLKKLSISKVGVTGSTGKTTTKEMLYYILSEKYKVGRNLGNFNNHIGLPLTILSLEQDIEVGVFEMGMSEFGEIDVLADIVRPDIGVITNIGTSHIENLGDREGILKAKLEITNYFKPNQILCVNGDNEMLSKENCEGDYQLIRVGTTGRNGFIISNILDFGEQGIEFSMEHKEEIQTFRLNIPGRHNAFNGALAIATAYQLGVTMKEAATGLLKLELTDKRLNIKGKNGMKIIDDTYNASPDSMKAALDVLVTTRGVRKIAILGDMMEMGPNSAEYHAEIGAYAADMKVDKLICIGKEAKNIVAGALKSMKEGDIIYGEKKEKVYGEILDMVAMGDVILVKGSRGMKMDEIVKKIMEKK